MKQTRSLVSRFRGMALALAAALLCQTASADTFKKWSELEQYLKNKYVTVATRDGTRFSGRFVEMRDDTLVLDNGMVIEIPHASFAYQVIEIRRSNLKTYSQNVKRGYSHVFHLLFSGSALAPFGLIEAPGMTIYAILGAPLSALGDLADNRTNSSERVTITK
jgi:hypothetical protein